MTVSLPTFKTTPMNTIPKIHASLRANFAGRNERQRSLAFRKQQLGQLVYMVTDHRDAWLAALRADVGRHEFESDIMELNALIKDIKDAHDNVEKWAKTERAPFSLDSSFMNPVIRKDPKGVVLIISPFNYPVFLALSPLAAAIAAGNACVLKPSEQAPATSALFADLFPKYLDPDLHCVVNGGIPETTEILKLPWDHIMYTGNDRVAKVIARAAAEHLTPLTLELGGKSPAIVDPNCDLQATARRIWYGKVSNAGQTCVAPDYVIVPRHFQDQLIEALKAVNEEFFPSGALSSPDFARIVNSHHVKRIQGLIARTQGTVVFGSAEECDAEKRFVPPTLVSDVKKADSLMSEEIFGPVLPIVPVEDFDEAIAFINDAPHPLALYIFTYDKTLRDRVFDSTQSGAAVANETILHIGTHGLPFGGVGGSGYGAHTGKYGFDTFTHQRASMDAPFWLDAVMKYRFPPFTDKKKDIVMSIMGAKVPPRPTAQPVHPWANTAKAVVAASAVIGLMFGLL